MEFENYVTNEALRILYLLNHGQRNLDYTKQYTEVLQKILEYDNDPNFPLECPLTECLSICNELASRMRHRSF